MTPSEAAHGLDGGLAAGRARAELSRQGVAGAVHVSGTTVTVTASKSVSFLILPGGKTVSGAASADAERGTTQGSSP